jgi:hypothetical protein
VSLTEPLLSSFLLDKARPPPLRDVVDRHSLYQLD